MVSNHTGKTLTLCEKCQRAYWNKKSAEKRGNLAPAPRKRGPKKSARADIPAGHKECSVCKKVLPANEDNFYYKGDRGGRLNSHCKDCHKKRGKGGQVATAPVAPVKQRPAAGPPYKFLLVDPDTGMVRRVEAVVIEEVDLMVKNRRQLNPSTEEFFRWQGYEVAEVKGKQQK
jgi:hypothetical protein